MWLVLPIFVLAIYLAVGVILWCRWPLLRDAGHEAGYVGGMIISAFIWPLELVILAAIGMVLLVGRLFENLSRLFRDKR